jgi:hypothetical protein
LITQQRALLTNATMVALAETFRTNDDSAH